MTHEKAYAEYLRYLSRNDPTRTAMSYEDFVNYYELDMEQPEELTGLADPIHY